MLQLIGHVAKRFAVKLLGKTRALIDSELDGTGRHDIANTGELGDAGLLQLLRICGQLLVERIVGNPRGRQHERLIA